MGSSRETSDNRKTRNRKQTVTLNIFMVSAAAALIFTVVFICIKLAEITPSKAVPVNASVKTLNDTSSNEASAMETAEETSEETSSEEPVVLQMTREAPVYIDLVAVGDNLIHKELDVTVEKEDGSYYFDDCFSKQVKTMIADADIAMINQEVPCAGNQYGISGYPSFNAPTEVLDTLYRMGFDVLTLATNHALDKGETGLVNTLDYLHTNYPDILTTGTASSQEEYETIPVTEVSGIKIAVLNYTYGTNDIPLPNEYCINLLSDKEKIKKDIQKANEIADFVIVAPHWGIEYELEQSAEQEEMAKYIADCGADLIIGTHPHVVQPYEWIEASDGRNVLVYYSLGNFISAQSPFPRGLGGVARVTLKYYDGEVTISSCSMDFVVTYFTLDVESWYYDDFLVYMLRDFEDIDLSDYGVYNHPDFSVQEYIDIARNIQPDWE